MSGDIFFKERDFGYDDGTDRRTVDQVLAAVRAEVDG